MELQNLLSFRNVLSTGIDLGQRNVKCVQLHKSHKKVVLDNLFMLDLAKSNDDYPNNLQLAQKLAAAVEVNGFNKTKVSISGNNRHVQMLDFTLPIMPPKELRLVIAKNLEDTLKRPISEITFDYTAIAEGDGQIVRVYFSEVQDVIQTIEAVRAAKLNPVEMNASFLAIAEMLQFNEYTEPNKAYILVDQGERSTRTSLMLGHEVIASNCYPEGLGMINSNLILAKDMSYDEAEQIKTLQLGSKGADDETARAVVDDSYGLIVESIQNTIDFYLEQELGVAVKEIFLTGGGSVYGSIQQLLTTHYKMPATQVNPFRNIETLGPNSKVDPLTVATLAPFMAVAVGLSLGRIDW